MECATRSINSRLHAEPRTVIAVSCPHKPKVVYLLITSLLGTSERKAKGKNWGG